MIKIPIAMSGQKVRLVKVVPFPPLKIKEEVVSDDEETINCRVCSKTFANPVALRNHAKMEHFEVFLSGDPTAWTEPPPEPKPTVNRLKVKDEEGMQLKTQEILSSMSSGNLTSLASEDVSYIIIKSEDGDVDEQPKKKRMKLVKVPKEREVKSKQKEPQPITGPFECIQPSSLVADGICHQMFFSCCEYSAHHRDEHTRRRKGLRCQVCEKPLSSTDADQMPYTCEVCGAGFNASKELSEHTSIAHVKLKPFQCEVCHKRFTQQGGVQQHMRMHTGDRPFPCTFCPKSFTQKSGLDQHLRIHTKVKPYRCVICSKTFCQSIHLKQHMRTHTNVSPFQCGICQKRFKQSSHLNYHLRNHNPVNMSDEQKQKYMELISMMSKEVVEVEIASDQEHQDQLDNEQSEVEQIEQAVAEQSIQVISDEHGYILTDSPHETWSVQIVDSENN